jgi:hypothetical protein
MELFNIDGTTNTSFSIGTGTEQIEFRSFDGKFYYRNYGETWKEVASAGGKVRPWESNALFEQGEIVSYNGILWVVIQTHTSGLLFESESGKMGKIGVFDEITIFNVSTTQTFLINTGCANKIFVQGSSATQKTILLPDATKFQNGTSFEIQNDSNVAVYLQYNNGDSFKEIKSGSLMFVTLLSNATLNGTWSVYDFTVETGLRVISTKSGNYTANSNEVVPCNTTIVPITISLPPTPTNGDVVGVMDVRGSFGQNPVTISRNGKKIQDLAEDWVIDISNSYIEVFYIAARSSWFFKKVPNGSAGITPYDIYNNIAPKDPPIIDTFSISQNIFELGQTISSANPVIFTVIADAGTDPITTAIITDLSVPAPVANLTITDPIAFNTTYSFGPTPAISSSRDFRLSVTDGNLADEKTLSVKFLPKHYWGFFDATSITSANLSGFSSELRETLESYSFGTNSLPTGGYIYLVIPESFSTPSVIRDITNGVNYQISSFVVATISVTNSFGNTLNYKTIRSSNKTYGGNFIWQTL